ncbi:MAG: hypothetical protein OHK0022_48900 [Roseiflexaceae bacterium]
MEVHRMKGPRLKTLRYFEGGPVDQEKILTLVRGPISYILSLYCRFVNSLLAPIGKFKFILT